eukprot:gene9963-13396_t
MEVVNNQQEMEILLATIQEAVSSTNVETNRHMMDVLEQISLSEGGLINLTKIIEHDYNSISQEYKLLASIVLKNSTAKLWMGDSLRVMSATEKNSIREFLTRYLSEPSCRVAIQLSSLTAKLASYDLSSDQWPDLITSLTNGLQSSQSRLTNIRAIFSIDAVLNELASCSSVNAKKAYSKVCASLFPVIVTIWAQNLKLITQKLNTIELSRTIECMEKLKIKNTGMDHMLIFVIFVTKVLNKNVEKCFPSLSKINSMPCFMRTYLGSIQILTKFVRHLRGSYSFFCDNSMGSTIEDSTATLHNIPTGDNIASSCVFENSDGGYAIHVLEIENQDEENVDETEYFIPDDFLQTSMGGFFSSVNLILKLLKTLVTTPPALQKQYPVAMGPYVESYCTFYYKELIEEHSATSNNFFKSIGLDLSDFSCSTNSTDNCIKNQSQFSNEILPMKYLSLASILFLSNVLSCSMYDDASIEKKKLLLTKNVEEPDEDSQKDANEINIIQTINIFRRNYFNLVRSATLLYHVLFPLLSYSQSEIEQWGEDPEQFYLAQQFMSESQTIKCAAEGLVCGLFDISPDAVTNITANFLMEQSLQQKVTSTTLTGEADIFFWDAVYVVAGLGVTHLGQKINPTEWLQFSFAPLLNNLLLSPSAGILSNGQQVLKARLMWLLSVWMYHFDPNYVPSILKMLMGVIGGEERNSNDIVVQLYAVQAISSLAKLESFNCVLLLGTLDDHSRPLVLPLVESLCILASRLEESDTKITVLGIVGDVIQLIGPMINNYPILIPLTEYLWQLWNNSDENDPIKSTILEVLSYLVKAAKSESSSIHYILIPLIRFTTSNTVETSYLVKDGISLWLAVIRNTTTQHYSIELDGLFVSILKILEYIFKTYQITASNLTDGLLLGLIIELMLKLYDQLKYVKSIHYREKLWTIALLSIFPSRIQNNQLNNSNNNHNNNNQEKSQDFCIFRSILSAGKFCTLTHPFYSNNNSNNNNHNNNNNSNNNKIEFSSEILSYLHILNYLHNIFPVESLTTWWDTIYNISLQKIQNDENNQKNINQSIKSLFQLISLQNDNDEDDIFDDENDNNDNNDNNNIEDGQMDEIQYNNLSDINNNINSNRIDCWNNILHNINLKDNNNKDIIEELFLTFAADDIIAKVPITALLYDKSE